MYQFSFIDAINVLYHVETASDCSSHYGSLTIEHYFIKIKAATFLILIGVGCHVGNSDMQAICAFDYGSEYDLHKVSKQSTTIATITLQQ